MVRLVFDRKDKSKYVGVDSLDVDTSNADRAVSRRDNVGVGVGKGFSEPVSSPPLIPPSPPPSFKLDDDVRDNVDFFKNNYDRIFGMDSVVPSPSRVLELNLLFSLYSEVRELRKDLVSLLGKR